MTLILAKWTLDEYHQLVAAGILDDRKVELVRGDIVEMATEGELHAYSCHESGEYLTQLMGEQASVRQAHPVTLPNASEPEPDLAIVQRLGREYRSHHPYPENIFWIIEYADSSLDKDLQVKSSVYAEVGIREYWVVNLKDMQLIVCRHPQNSQYTTKTILTTGTIQPLAFPNLEISVDRLLRSES
ncbi:MAG: Uma2 family endonuclease [Leptolyngbyaceae cyanobacterium bins.349]|nr:Uma2 family endonuclease [Leptolyngbyaceae cyanobacterium bins.349]